MFQRTSCVCAASTRAHAALMWQRLYISLRLTIHWWCELCVISPECSWMHIIFHLTVFFKHFLERFPSFLGSHLFLAGGEDKDFLLTTLLFFFCVCVCISLSILLCGWNVWVHLVCWLMCHFEFTHLISQLLRDQNQIHFGSALPSSARLTSFGRRGMDSISVAVF